MVKKRVSNFSLIFLSLCCAVVILITVTTIKINNRHEEKLMYATKSKVEYYAKRCYLDKRCENEITLQMLYDNKYLTTIVNPVTKEVVPSDTTITYDKENDKIIVNWK